jgi:predicted dienelactone hydrolase
LTVAGRERSFGVEVFYPARQAGPGGSPLEGEGPVPLIVFSPGYDIDPDVYDPLVTGCASRGFVVARADYPFTSPGSAGGVNEADIVYHPADLEATIDELIGASRGTGVLHGMVDSSRIAVAGHSDGADVTDAVVSDSCCRDPRIRAAAVLSGAELTSFGGTYTAARVPLLVTQGNSDTINPPACSAQIYDTGGSPRYYLDLLGAGHLPPYTSDPSGAIYQRAVGRLTALFWEAYLDEDDSALAALGAGRALGPAAAWTAGGPIAQVGACPGAP